MSETKIPKTEPQQKLEGPWRKEATLTSFVLNEQLPYSQLTVRENYDQRFGAGNWKEDKTAHKTANDLGRFATQLENQAVRSAAASEASGNGFVTESGANARSLQARAWTDMSDIIVSPDGDAHAAARAEQMEAVQPEEDDQQS